MFLRITGRFLYAIPMAVFGVFHLMDPTALDDMVPVPGGIFWIYVTGVGLIAAAVAIMTGKYASLACLLLGIMLLIFVCLIDLQAIFGTNNELRAQTAIPTLLKDISLAGGAFFLSAIFAEEERVKAAS